jgi:hypothetical protein
MQVQSERQQLLLADLLRVNLDGYLSLAPDAQASAANAYQHLLAWKGAVFMRQFAGHASRRRADLKNRFDELNSVCGRLSNLALRIPDPKRRAAWQRQMADLSDRKEALEGELSNESIEFRQEQALKQLTPAALQRILPEHVALVDCLEYTLYSPARGGKGPLQQERRLVAFIVQRDRPISRVELGPVKPLAAAAEAWRRAILGDGGAAEEVTANQTDAARKPPQQILKELLWDPLQKQLENAQTVLISPDGVINRIPLAALPGQRAGSYLLEEIRLAVVPVPRLLPLLLGGLPKGAGASTRTAPAAGNAGEQSLLLIGDVSYGGSPGKVEGVVVASRTAVR